MNHIAEWPALGSIHTIAFDFDGVFTNNKVYVDQNGVESVRCDRGDGLGIDLLLWAQRKERLNAELFILSKEPNPVVLARAKKLKLDCRHGLSNKKGYMDKHFETYRPDDANPYRGMIYLGNDLNDLPMIIAAGFSVAPSDAHPRVKSHASVVLEPRGGEGFVRVFVEKLLDVPNMSMEDINECIYYR